LTEKERSELKKSIRDEFRKRIEELESKIVSNPQNYQSIDAYNIFFLAKQNELQKVLSQSTPLVLVVKDALQKGEELSRLFGNNKIEEKQDYISNLKLDI
jgi:hypothetical protein